MVSGGDTHCASHRYQSRGYQAGTSRLSASQPVLSAQGSFDLFSDMDDDEVEAPVSVSVSPKGYEGKPDTMPRYALFRGRKVRVISYEENSTFRILDTDDTYRTLPRSMMTFLPDKPKKQHSKLI
jgi:hypothetical protein